MNCLPKCKFLNVKEFEDYFSSNKEIISDATEQAIQRPKDKEEQENTYSGKRNTRKVIIISSESKNINYISLSRGGKIHDYTLLKEEFPPKKTGLNTF